MASVFSMATDSTQTPEPVTAGPSNAPATPVPGTTVPPRYSQVTGQGPPIPIQPKRMRAKTSIPVGVKVVDITTREPLVSTVSADQASKCEVFYDTEQITHVLIPEGEKKFKKVPLSLLGLPDLKPDITDANFRTAVQRAMYYMDCFHKPQPHPINLTVAFLTTRPLAPQMLSRGANKERIIDTAKKLRATLSLPGVGMSYAVFCVNVLTALIDRVDRLTPKGLIRMQSIINDINGCIRGAVEVLIPSKIGSFIPSRGGVTPELQDIVDHMTTSATWAGLYDRNKSVEQEASETAPPMVEFQDTVTRVMDAAKVLTVLPETQLMKIVVSNVYLNDLPDTQILALVVSEANRRLADESRLAALEGLQTSHERASASVVGVPAHTRSENVVLRWLKKILSWFFYPFKMLFRLFTPSFWRECLPRTTAAVTGAQQPGSVDLTAGS